MQGYNLPRRYRGEVINPSRFLLKLRVKQKTKFVILASIYWAELYHLSKINPPLLLIDLSFSQIHENLSRWNNALMRHAWVIVSIFEA